MDIKFHWRPEEDNAFEEFTGNISDKDTMAFFNPKLPIMARVEAIYNEGLAFPNNPPGAGNRCIS